MEPEKPVFGRGSFLIANGNLLDPNFLHTVVLLCEHNDSGSYGLVLNRTSELFLSEVFAGNPLLKNSSERLFYGGPCEPERIQVIHNCDVPDLGAFKVSEGLFLGGKFEEILRMKSESPATVACRFFSGYAGWGEGQLDNEMEINSWILHPVSVAAVFHQPVEKMWHSLLSSMGDYYAFVARMPKDPRNN